MRAFLRMLSFVAPYKGKFALLLLVSLFYGLFAALPFWLGKNVLQVLFMQEGGTRMLNTVCVLFFLVFVFLGYFEWRRIYLSNWIANRCVIDVNNRLMNHLLQMELGYFERRKSGDLISRITYDSAALQRNVQTLSVMVREPFTVIATYGTALIIDWRLTLVGSIGLPLAVILVNPLLRLIRRASRRGREVHGERTDALTQFFTGIRTVKAYSLEDTHYEGYRDANERIFGYQMRVISANALSRPALHLMAGLGVTLVVFIGGKLTEAGRVRPDDLIVCIAALLALHRPMRSLLQAANTASETLAGADRLFEIFDERPTITEAPDAKPLETPVERITFEHVGFSYGRDAVLRDINLDIPAGRTVAFVGPSGAGKSTLLSLLCRFYDPTEGRVTINGDDLRDLRIRSLLSRIAVVTQEPFLFNISVRENIRHGRPEATDAEIEEAARAANVHDEILAFPDGYDTPCGERGSQLSGGQRQRVSIARAILRNSPILILDEATSSLDSASEKLVQAAIDELVKGRTSLVIAHRLSTVRNADCIVVLSEGRVLGSGTHDELLESNTVYRHLWEIQTGTQPVPAQA